MRRILLGTPWHGKTAAEPQSTRRAAGGRCTDVGAIGCTCAGHDGCPADVSVCFAGVCTARPLPGEPYEDGLPCFDSLCHEGTCVVTGREGAACVERPCAAPLRCVAGVCAR